MITSYSNFVSKPMFLNITSLKRVVSFLDKMCNVQCIKTIQEMVNISNRDKIYQVLIYLE